MRKVDELLARYGESHRNPANKAIHWVCVPLITWSVLAALWGAAPIAAYVGIGVAIVFYLWLSLPLAIGMLVVLAAMVYPLAALGGQVWLVAAAVFVAAWIGQFIGHAIEGRKPSFFEDVKFLLVGPAWLLSDLYRKLGIRY
ncbi:MAG TPA: Mpo1-like protein [Casimicrobiaceae bacterium]